MDECDFKSVAQNSKDILLPLADGSKIAEKELTGCIDEIYATYKKYYDRGLEPRQISHILLDAALAMMIASRDLGQAALFSEFVRDSGDRTRKTIGRHWPPIDKESWPIDPKQWPLD